METVELTKQEKEYLDLNIQDLKKLIIKKFSYYMINQSKNTKMKYLKYLVLSSWFSDITTYDEFVKKFTSFSNVLGNEDIKELFQNVKHISTIKEDNREEIINDTIKMYHDITNTKLYQQNTSKSGYNLSNIYLESNNYKDLSIHKNIFFTQLLYTYLINIDKYFNELRQEIINNRKNVGINREKKYE